MAGRRTSPIDQEHIQPEMCSVDVRLQILGRAPFFKGLSADQVAEINRLFRDQGYQADETIYYAGDPAERLYVVAAGKVKLIRHTSRGKDVLLDILTPGEFFGSLSTLGSDEYPETAQAQTTSCILSIGSEQFRIILDSYPIVALQVLDTVSARLRESQEMVRQVSAHSVERRIAYTLLKLGEKFGVEQEMGLLIQAPLSRDDLAQMTGATTETTSRVISQFQRSGMIRSGRQWIAITDRQGLEAIAKE